MTEVLANNEFVWLVLGTASEMGSAGVERIAHAGQVCSPEKCDDFSVLGDSEKGRSQRFHISHGAECSHLHLLAV